MGKVNKKPQKKHNISEEAFCDFFTNVGPKLAEQIEESEEDPINSIKHETNRSMYFRSVNDQEVLKLLKKLDIRKAVGCDKVSAQLLNEGAETIAPHLAVIGRLSLKYGQVFDLMKIAKIIPIFKADDPNLPSNYRPVSVLSVLSKILERIVHTRLSEFFATILTKHQYGFRKNLNTELALINFYQSLIDKLDKGFIGFGLFIDLKKAFDTVDHKILLRKLVRYGVCGPVLSWFKDYLSGRTQYVKIDGKKSDSRMVLCGVPQGSILGPLLFIIYIND
jgi:retron-type reverse transcriptase